MADDKKPTGKWESKFPKKENSIPPQKGFSVSDFNAGQDKRAENIKARMEANAEKYKQQFEASKLKQQARKTKSPVVTTKPVTPPTKTK